MNKDLERYKQLSWQIDVGSWSDYLEKEYKELESTLNEKLEIVKWLKQYDINTLFELQKVFLGFPQMKEKAEKYDDLMSANSEVVKSNITLTEAQQQIKQLKEELEIYKTLQNGHDQIMMDYPYMVKKIQDLKSQLEETQEIVFDQTLEIGELKSQNEKLQKVIDEFKSFDILDLIEVNNEIDDYSVNEKVTLEKWENKLKSILQEAEK